MNRHETSRFSGFNATLAFAALASVLVGTAGCDELRSRREIQEANKLFGEGRYNKAVEVYSEALRLTPGLAIGHHNAGLAYYKLFQPGVETKENRALAEQSAQHFMTYLESEPNDTKVIGLLTTIWLDSGQYDKALSYWSAVLAKDPQSRDVIEKLANINRQAGDYVKAREWHLKRVDLEADRGGKVKAYLDIAQMEWSRLQKPDLVDAERLAVVDIGLASLQQAEKLDPKHALVQSLMGSLYQHRSVAHGAHWAKGVEAASQRFHQGRFTDIRKGEQAAAGAPQPGQPAPAGQPGQPAPAGQPGQPAPAGQPGQTGAAPAPTGSTPQPAPN
ncbi:MAG TPA: tetratricopeptide repeat protein [Kofleriaceae bacterium]|nr:tetratricopeptide repeat protein [Kofleriaceae bacterium]